MSYSNPETPTSGCCSPTTSAASAELKLYQAFIFSVPIFFTFILLLLFYWFYLRRRRVDWSSLRMRTSLQDNNDISRHSELGLKKELREMLPIIVYKESFSVRDTQCSVCLGDYQAEDRLQQIPACGHTFHMDCIDHWLATHSTCPLCRLSLLASPKPRTEAPDIQVETSQSCDAESGVETSLHRPQAHEETEPLQAFESRNGDVIILQNGTEEEERSSQCVDHERGSRDGRNETDGHEHR